MESSVMQNITIPTMIWVRLSCLYASSVLMRTPVRFAGKPSSRQVSALDSRQSSTCSYTTSNTSVE